MRNSSRNGLRDPGFGIGLERFALPVGNILRR
jgi:hypothetical protein